MLWLRCMVHGGHIWGDYLPAPFEWWGFRECSLCGRVKRSPKPGNRQIGR